MADDIKPQLDELEHEKAVERQNAAAAEERQLALERQQTELKQENIDQRQAEDAGK